MRYAWDLQHQYLRESGLERGFKSWVVRWLLHKVRIWDYRTAAGVDHFISNSQFISRRIKKVYGRSSYVIYPPVDIDAFEFCDLKLDYYLTASRLVPYKRMDLIISAFNLMPQKKLVVIGDGPEMAKLKAMAGHNVEILGHLPFVKLKRYLQEAKAFVFASEEDFGITPVEAQACGTAVIAYGKGGALETVVDSSDPTRATGIWFGVQSAEAIVESVQRFEALANPISGKTCRENASRFSIGRFRREFVNYVDSCWEEMSNSSRGL